MKDYLSEIDAVIMTKHLLKHPFYQAWSRGELSISCLQEYAKEYYQHVKAFPTYLSILHSRTESAPTRRVLLQNLIEEEAGSPNHPELWREFAFALGVSEQELDSHETSCAMQKLVRTFRTICGEQSTAEGIAALYGYESQIPEICESKIAGLQQFYGMNAPQNWHYFQVHIEADKEHAAQERALLQHYVSVENQQAVMNSLTKALDGLWGFLSSLCHKYQISEAPCCH